MKTETYDGSRERRVLTSLLFDDSVCKAVASRWNGRLFESDMANVVAGMAIEYSNKYNQAPGLDIVPLFEEWAETADKSTVSLVESFLDDLDEPEETTNSRVAVDRASNHLQRVAARRLGDAIAADPDRASELMSKFEHVGFSSTDYVAAMQSAQDSVFEDMGDRRLIEFGGPLTPLDEFFHGMFLPDTLLSFIAPEKGAKSFWLLELACRAAECRKRVAYFVVGDMSRDQVLERLYARITRRPIPGEREDVEIPQDILLNEENTSYTTRIKKKIRAYTQRDVVEAMERLKKTKFKSDTEFLRLATFPAGTKSVGDLENVIDSWGRDETNWIPDVVVIDYADELLPPPGHLMGSREGIGATWRELRRLSQQLHVLVATATQADAAARNQMFLTRMNYSESKQKDAHVNGMCAINEHEASGETENGIQRLSWLFRRKGKTNTRKFVTVAGCRDLGRIAIRATWKAKPDVEDDEDEDEES